MNDYKIIPVVVCFDVLYSVIGEGFDMFEFFPSWEDDELNVMMKELGLSTL